MTPVHSDKRRFSVFDPLLVVAGGFMITQGIFTNDGAPILIGLGLLMFLAFTKHSRYELFEDALVVRYWAPRRIVIQFSQVQGARIAKLPFGGTSILINRAGGRILAIMPKDPDAFLGHLNARLGPEYESLAPSQTAVLSGSAQREELSDSPEPSESPAPETSPEPLIDPGSTPIARRRRPRRRGR
jgi:hypothetical protein